MKAYMSKRQQGVCFCNWIAEKCKLNQWSCIWWIFLYWRKILLANRLASLLVLGSSPYLFRVLSIPNICLANECLTDLVHAILLQIIVYTVQDDIEAFSHNLSDGRGYL